MASAGNMTDQARLRALRVALVLVGLTFIFGLFLLTRLWPSAWMWEPRQYEYEQMILGVYATLGVFLVIAARDPLANRSLIWFTIASSIVHGGIMLVQAIVDPTERAHLVGDVPALLLVAAVLWWLMPPAARPQAGATVAGR
jgi:hypothetical protein